MDRLQHLPLIVLYVGLIAGGVLAGAIGATLHLAIEHAIDWTRGRRT
jgi:hypothetical protein